MTVVNITKDPERLRVCLTATGHAETATKGEDLLCASISVLVFGFAKEISKIDGKHVKKRIVLADDSAPADATVDVICNDERTYKRVEYNLAPVERALEALHGIYPDNLKLFSKVIHAEGR